MKGLIPKTQLYLKQRSPTILTWLGAVGVVATAVTAVRATPKALKIIAEYEETFTIGFNRQIKNEKKEIKKREIVALTWKCYIPSAVIGVGTLCCIFGANTLNRYRQATLSSAYVLVSNAYQDYKNKVKELYGEETHQRIVDEIVKENCKDIYISAPGICGSSSLDFDEHDPKDNRLFYDSFSKRYFESSVSRVIEAEYHLNRNWWLGAGICLNDFYELLGLEPIDGGDELSWFQEDGIGWIDFDHHKTILDDGREVYAVYFVFTPRLITEYD